MTMLPLVPSARDAPPLSVTARLTRTAGDRVTLYYEVTGAVSDLYVPPRRTAERLDDLWRRTCFEAFIGAPGRADYLELNLSPSTCWAAYGFSGHRVRAADPDIAAPQIEVSVSADRLTLRAETEIGGLVSSGPWRVGLTAVIETLDGALSYWALAHAPGRPDFHDAATFTALIPEPA